MEADNLKEKLLLKWFEFHGVDRSALICSPELNNLMETLDEVAKEWAIEIVSASLLEKCCCKNPDVDCYFCQIRDEILKKLEEN